jgi:hypothetical protein
VIKIGSLIILTALLMPLNCGAKDVEPINDKTVRKLIQYYFPADERISNDSQPAYVTGDFNDDGLNDIAVLFYPQEKIKPSKQLQLSWPWTFDSSVQSNKYHKSLAIINGCADGWLSQNTKVFVLLDKSGILETPSFHLIVSKRSASDYRQHLKLLDLHKAGDLIILPTEAGIDTYILWNRSNYKLYVPEELP